VKIIPLAINPAVYSSNAYLVLGSWNTLDDINTLVDTGNDPSIIEQIQCLNTGVGKKPVEQIILTHGHFDHKGLLGKFIELYSPVVYSFAPLNDRGRKVRDGQLLHVGDRYFEVLHTPGHSHDSICLYCAEDKVLFSGDTPLQIRSPGGSYIASFIEALKKISTLRIDVIYSGHDAPMKERPEEIIRETLANVRKSETTSVHDTW